MLVVLSGSEMTSSSFSMAESFFRSWNKTSCALSIPQRMAQSCSTEELAAKITTALDLNTFRTVQATAKRRFLLKFSSFSAASSVMTAGIEIEGVHLTPMVAFDRLTSVFVSRIPPRVLDDQFVKAFSPFGRVVSVKSLLLRLQPSVFWYSSDPDGSIQAHTLFLPGYGFSWLGSLSRPAISVLSVP